jgi:hypothetical protein
MVIDKNLYFIITRIYFEVCSWLWKNKVNIVIENRLGTFSARTKFWLIIGNCSYYARHLNVIANL